MALNIRNTDGKVLKSALTDRYIRSLTTNAATIPNEDDIDNYLNTPIIREGSLLLDVGAHKTGFIYAAGNDGSSIPLTFTRNGSATRFNEQGVLETVYNNYPRLEFDPNVIVPDYVCPKLGTNFLHNSDNPTFSPATRNLNVHTNPFGVANSAAEFIKTAGTAQYLNFNTATTLQASTKHEYSFYVKHIGNDLTFRAEPNSTGGFDAGGYWSALFNLTSTTCTTSTTAFCTSRVEPSEHGFHRVVVTINTGSNITATGVVLVRIDGVTGTKICAFGGQLQEGDATSYISTGSNPVTAQIGTHIGNRQVRGYWQERASTNLVLNSGNPLATNWTTISSTKLDSGEKFRDMVGVKVASTGAVWNRVYSITMTSVSTTMGVTFFYKGGSSNRVRVLCRNSTKAFETLVTGTISGTKNIDSQAAGTVVIIEDISVGSGVRKISLLFTSGTPTDAHEFAIGPDTATSGQDVIVFGSQVESGSPSTYIPTGSAAVSRVQETFNNLNYASFGSNFGVLGFVAATHTNVGDNTFQISDNSDNNAVHLVIRPTQIQATIRGGGGPTLNVFSAAIIPTNFNKAALRFDGSNSALFANGIKTNMSSADRPIGLNRVTSYLWWGGNPFNGILRNLYIFRTLPADSELQTITT